MTLNKTLLDADEKKLKNYFERQIKLGNLLKTEQLKQYAKNRKLKVSSKFIRNIRNIVLPTVLFKPPINIKVYQTITVDRIGLLSMDYAYYPKPRLNWARFNKGAVGYLMINCNATHKRHAVPMKGRTSEEFEKVLDNVCRGNIFPAIRTIMSDRETAITSRKFKKKMFDKYGVRFSFITRYNKAWASEAAIHDVKTSLSRAMTNNGKKWIDVLEEVIASHNRTKIDGTSYSPNEINVNNFYEFINEQHEFKEATMAYNTNSIDSRSILDKKWIKQLFKFYLNERVLASNYALKGREVFGKQSVDGTFSKTPFIIKRAKLRHTKKNTLVPGV